MNRVLLVGIVFYCSLNSMQREVKVLQPRQASRDVSRGLMGVKFLGIQDQSSRGLMDSQKNNISTSCNEQIPKIYFHNNNTERFEVTSSEIKIWREGHGCAHSIIDTISINRFNTPGVDKKFLAVSSDKKYLLLLEYSSSYLGTIRVIKMDDKRELRSYFLPKGVMPEPATCVIFNSDNTMFAVRVVDQKTKKLSWCVYTQLMQDSLFELSINGTITFSDGNIVDETGVCYNALTGKKLAQS